MWYTSHFCFVSLIFLSLFYGTIGEDSEQWIQATFQKPITAKRVIISDLYPCEFTGFINRGVELQWYDLKENKWTTHITTSVDISPGFLHIQTGGVAYIPLPQNISTTAWRLYRKTSYLGTGMFSFA